MVNRWLSTVLAVVGTVVVVLVFLALFGQDGSSPGSAVTTQRPTPAIASTTAPSATSSPSGTSGSGASPTTAPSELRAPVVVLNQTGVKGLAGRTEKTLEAGGWRVTDIGDFSGTVPSNTVYFAPGLAAQARALTGQFPQITTRTKEAFVGLPAGRLTLILTKDWR